ncbi:MAG: undecaprenyl/decaprenyl-phosphate alpha-N-acetylglucosaminyl 1-phosphate transferase [Eggerthellaceae bacterium]|nr:undecaprenyl/decaprenyl-phosphate alpha-N-acetylglucosaminyl 1-phosphate transferase [Eggerthellaceae bacterium]
MEIFEGILVFVLGLVNTMLCVPFAKWLSKKLDAIDYPDERRINQKPTPRLGGIAIFFGVVVSLGVLWVGVKIIGWESPFTSHPTLKPWYPGVSFSLFLMFAVGMIDDMISLNPKLKFMGQFIAACFAVSSGIIFENIYNPFIGQFIEFKVWAYPITIIYLVSFANIINLIDGLDGLASGISIISAITMLTLSLMTGRIDATILCLALIGPALGFLKLNYNPASIFMGDSGALLLGFMLGIISIISIARTTMVISILIPLLTAGVPIVDTLSAIVRRKRANQKIDQADRGHVHHRLVQEGYSQKTTVFIMWGWSAVMSICGIMIILIDKPLKIPFFIVIIASCIFAVFKLHLFRPVLQHHFNPRPRRNKFYTLREYNKFHSYFKEVYGIRKQYRKPYEMCSYKRTPPSPNNSQQRCDNPYYRENY